MEINILKTFFKSKMMAYQQNIIVEDKAKNVLDEIPDDSFVIDYRKIPKSLFAFPDKYVIEYAHSLGYTDDKIILLYECYAVRNPNDVYYHQGTLCDETVDEFIQRYKDLGIYIDNPYEKEYGDA